MRTLLVWMVAAPLWAATATKDQTPALEWESMPKEAVTRDVAAASTPAAPLTPAEPKAPSLADALAKPAQAAPEQAVDLFPPPLLIATGLAILAMVGYIVVAKVL
ncbi:MAG: hypothetical protein JNL62_01865 [Bryobacterales bacterium]|nr:hypothetical protein [Bryobacterales bacterium]